MKVLSKRILFSKRRMYLIAVLMAMLTSRHLLIVDGMQLHLSESTPQDAGNINDYPELMGILQNLLNEDGEKCLDMSVDCSDFPAGACDAVSKKDDFDMPDYYCHKVLCCSEEMAREKMVFTRGVSSTENAAKARQMVQLSHAVNDDIRRANQQFQVPHEFRQQSSTRININPTRTKNRFIQTHGLERGRPQKLSLNDFNTSPKTKLQLNKPKTKPKFAKHSQFQTNDQRLPRKSPEPEKLETPTTTFDQVSKSSKSFKMATTLEPEVPLTSEEPKRHRTKPPQRKKSKKFRKPIDLKDATTSLPIATNTVWEDSNLGEITDTTERIRSSKNMWKSKPMHNTTKNPSFKKNQSNKFPVTDIPLPLKTTSKLKNATKIPKEDNESISTTIIKDFTTPKSFREMWHEKGNLPNKGLTPQESQQRFEVEQNFLEMCGSIAAHAGNLNYTDGNSQGSTENDLKANGAICYEDYANPQRGSSRSKAPSRKRLKGSLLKGDPRVYAQNPYKPRAWPKKTVRPLKQPLTRKRPQFPTQMYYYPKRPSRVRPIYPVESETDEDFTQDECDNENAEGDFETQLNTYSENSETDERFRNYDMDLDLNRNSLYDELDDGDFDRILNEGYEKSVDKGRRRLSSGVSSGGKPKKPSKPPSVYLSNIVKPLRGRKVSVPSHDFRELRLFGKFYNHRGELCDDATNENGKRKDEYGEQQQSDSGSRTEETEEEKKRKPIVQDDQPSDNSSESEELKKYNMYSGRQRGKQRQRDEYSRYSKYFT